MSTGQVVAMGGGSCGDTRLESESDIDYGYFSLPSLDRRYCRTEDRNKRSNGLHDQCWLVFPDCGMVNPVYWND